MATGLLGLASGFLLIFLARMGIGLGQAMLSPTVYSLLADNFPKKNLARACSYYASGSFIGLAVILITGGYFAERSLDNMLINLPLLGPVAAWRACFIGAGIIGLIYAMLIPLLINDRRQSISSKPPSFFSVMQFIHTHRRLISRHFIGFSFCAMAMFTLIAWSPAYFIRVQGVNAATAGKILAFGFLIANVSGVLFSGIATDYLNRIGKRDAPLIIGSSAALMTALSIILFSIGGNSHISLFALFLALHFSSYVIAPSAATLQTITPQHMRARVYALFLCLNNLIGMSIGSAMVGVLNDYIFQKPQAVGISMAITVGIASILGACILTSGRQYYLQSLQQLKAIN